MILSQKQIEEIAAAVTRDFNEFFFGCETDKARIARATPIDQFATDYLSLDVSFARLSSDGSIYGLTAYENTEYIIEESNAQRSIALRRFTLAHECAHQILFYLETDEVQDTCRKKYAARKAYSLRELKTHEDWNEWQANVLGAAILMPQREIDLAMWYFAGGKALVNYEGRFSYRDDLALNMTCQQLGVSKSAAVIRLRQLGYIEDRPYSEYVNPLEVWA